MQGDIDNALEVLDDPCRKQSDHAAPWEIRGLPEATAGQPNSAIHYFKRARQFARLEVGSVRTMALQYVALNKIPVAIDILHTQGMKGHLETSCVRMLSKDLINLGAADQSLDMLIKATQERPEGPLL